MAELGALGSARRRRPPSTRQHDAGMNGCSSSPCSTTSPETGGIQASGAIVGESNAAENTSSLDWSSSRRLEQHASAASMSGPSECRQTGSLDRRPSQKLEQPLAAPSAASTSVPSDCRRDLSGGAPIAPHHRACYRESRRRSRSKNWTGSARMRAAVVLGAALLDFMSADFKKSLGGAGGRGVGRAWRPPVYAAADGSQQPRDYLSEDSVVLITGAAGFIGSELAVALHSTYSVRKLLLVDSMASGLGNGGPSTSSSRTEAEFVSKVQSDGLRARTEEELALFEFKRQRAFRLLQAAGARAHFYRSDFRPTIPEYFDVGEVPLLDTIFRTHPDITHVVHLADPYHGAMVDRNSDGRGGGGGVGQTQAVPRTKEDTKSGMIEAIFEQLKKVGDERGRDAIPHLTYASSSEVYYHLSQYDDNPNPPPFREDLNVTVPSSLRGAAKLIDEVLASAYNDMHGLYSVGLRLFNVYGPWGLPGTPLFEMAERAVSDRETPVLSASGVAEMGIDGRDVRDYIHLDDAVDGIMAAMQFRPRRGEYDEDDNGGAAADPPNVVINLGTGQGSTLREAAGIMERHFPRTTSSAAATEDDDASGERQSPTVSYASTERAEALLGFTPRISLEDGLANLLAWHYDRAFPYGGRPAADEDEDEDTEDGQQKPNESDGENYIASRGIESCSPLDRECLRGAPVFPCASECSNPSQCVRTYFDDAVYMSRSVSDGCGAVLYTVSLGDDVDAIPSANVAVDPKSVPYVEESGLARCNIAFVSEGSPLVRRLKAEKRLNQRLPVAEEFYHRVEERKDVSNLLLRHGHWTLVPVASSAPTGRIDDTLRLLPKLSPGSFFGPSTRRAIYAAPDVTFRNVPEVLRHSTMQPLKEGMEGVTAMVVGDGLADERGRRRKVSSASADPRRADPGEARAYAQRARDRAQAEALQQRAYNMIRVGLRGEMPGGGTLPIPDASWAVHALGVEDARLFRCDAYGEVLQWETGGGGSDDGDDEADERALEFVMGLHDLWSRVIVRWGGAEPWWTGEGVEVGPEGNGEEGEGAAGRRRRLTDLVGFSGFSPQGSPEDSNAVITEDAGMKSDPLDDGMEYDSFWDEVAETSHDHRRLEETIVRVEDENKNNRGVGTAGSEGGKRTDSWMGVLSSTETHYFIRIMPSSMIGAVHLGDYDF